MSKALLGLITTRIGTAVFLFALGFTFYFLFPRYFNYSKYKSLQFLFLFVFLILGVFFLPTIAKTYFFNFPFLALILIYDSIILFLSFFLFRNQFDSTILFFIKREDAKKLISDVLLKIGWNDIQVTEDETDSIVFRDPNQSFLVQAFADIDRFMVSLLILGKLNGEDRGRIRRLSLLLKYDLSTIPEDKEMVKMFRQKHLRYLLLSYVLFFVLQFLRYVLIR